MIKDSLAHEGLPEEYEDEKFEDHQQAPSGGQPDVKVTQRSRVDTTNGTQSNDKYSDEQFEQPAPTETARNEAAAEEN